MSTCNLQLYKVESLLECRKSLLFFCLFILRLCGQLVIIDGISQLEFYKTNSFEVSREHLIMVQHKFFALNRKLLEERLLVVPPLPIIIYLLDFILLVTHLQMNLFQQSLKYIILVF